MWHLNMGILLSCRWYFLVSMVEHVYILMSWTAFNNDQNCYSQLFVKKCKYIEKKVIRYINDNLSGFSSSDESNKENFFFNTCILKVLAFACNPYSGKKPLKIRKATIKTSTFIQLLIYVRTQRICEIK